MDSQATIRHTEDAIASADAARGDLREAIRYSADGEVQKTLRQARGLLNQARRRLLRALAQATA